MSSTLVIIPAYNEAGKIGDVAASCIRHAPVLVVDDGSADGTAGIARDTGAHIIEQPYNMGKGAALRTGLEWGLEEGYKDFITLDADGQHDPDEIPAFMKCPSENLVIGYRKVRKMPFPRNISNSIGRRLMEWATGEIMLDNQSGYRRIPSNLAREILSSSENGFEFEVEMIARHIARYGKIDWIPIKTIYADEKSHIAPIQHVFNFLRITFHCRDIIKGKR